MQIEPNDCFTTDGVYNSQSAELKKIRNEISTSFTEWNEGTDNKDFRKKFSSEIRYSGTLIRNPKEFESDNLAIEFLKLKEFYTQESIPDKEI